MKKQSNITIKIIIGISLIVGVTALYLLFGIESSQKPLAGQGTMYDDNVQIGGDFELIDQNGEIFNSDRLKGKLSLIYFGFTYCPDICPTSLHKLTEIMNVLDKYQINVTPIFITIDPERDSAALLQEYLQHFHSKFIGLTGTKEQIKQVADKFKVYYAKIDQGSAQSNNYMIDHSSFVYVMNSDGQYVKHFYLDSTPEEIINFIRVINQPSHR